MPTRPERGGAAVLTDCADLVAELGDGKLPVGIGLCELVDLAGRPASADTIDWRDLDPAAAIEAPRRRASSPTSGRPRWRRRASVRAPGSRRFSSSSSARARAHASSSTGARTPARGARRIVLGAPPVELVASGRALARAAGVDRARGRARGSGASAARRRGRRRARRRAGGSRQRARPVAGRPRGRSRRRARVPGARRAGVPVTARLSAQSLRFQSSAHRPAARTEA